METKCPTEIQSNTCNTVFDCETSQASFTLSGPLECGVPVTATVLFIKCDGTRATSPIVPLTMSINGTIIFVGASDAPGYPAGNNLLNTYTITPGIDTGSMVAFMWGHPDDAEVCSKTFPYFCEQDEGFKSLPSTDQFPPATESPELPNPGQTVTLSTGVTIECLPGATHQYATRSATNADGTKYLDAAGNIYSIPGFSLLGSSGVNSESVWSNTNPNIIYGINSATGTINIVDCSGASAPIDTGIPAVGIGAGEGGISANDQCIVVNTNTQICTYSLVAPYNQLGWIPIPTNYDTHKISMDGNCVAVIQDLPTDLTTVYNRDMTPKAYSPIAGSSGHGTMAIDCNGNQVYVYYDDPITAIDLATGTIYPILPAGTPFTGTQWHVSYSPANPGWVTVSALDPSGGGWIGQISVCPGNTEVTVLTDGYMNAGNANTFACQAKVSAGISGNQWVFDSCDVVSDSKSYLVTCS